MVTHSAPPCSGTEDLPWIECEACKTFKREEFVQCKVCYKSICKDCDEATPETGPVCSVCNEKSSSVIDIGEKDLEASPRLTLRCPCSICVGAKAPEAGPRSTLR